MLAFHKERHGVPEPAREGPDEPEGHGEGGGGGEGGLDPDPVRVRISQQMQEQANFLEELSRSQDSTPRSDLAASRPPPPTSPLPPEDVPAPLKPIPTVSLPSLRGLVSGDKRRMQDGEFDLDLTYVTPRVIAMSMPVPSDSVLSLFRNSFDEVSRFLTRRHGGDAKVFNLCEEYEYPSDRFGNGVEYCPFADHEVPSVESLLSLCRKAHEWLRASSRRVVAIHCKGGKGRTGTAVCALLMYTGAVAGAAEALALFRERRTSDAALARGGDMGVTGPSQRRLVLFLGDVIASYRRPASPSPPLLSPLRPPRRLLSLCIHPVAMLLRAHGAGATLVVSVGDHRSEGLASSARALGPSLLEAPYLEMVLRTPLGGPLWFSGEVRVEVCVESRGIVAPSRAPLFFAWVHADMAGGGELCIAKGGLDLLSGDASNASVEAGFKCTLVFDPIEGGGSGSRGGAVSPPSDDQGRKILGGCARNGVPAGQGGGWVEGRLTVLFSGCVRIAPLGRVAHRGGWRGLVGAASQRGR